MQINQPTATSPLLNRSKLKLELAKITSTPTLKETSLPKHKPRWNYIIGGIILFLLIIGGGAGYWLTQQSQDLRQQAKVSLDPYSCENEGEIRCNRTTGLASACEDGTWVSYGRCDTNTGCATGFKLIDGACHPNECKKVGDKIVCGGGGDDPDNCGAIGRKCNPGLNCVDGYCVGGNPSDYECTIGGNDCGAGSTCHCTGGDACTGTKCDSSIKDSCERQGRVYTTNHQGFGMTCCIKGYVACSSSDGCCPGSSVPSPTPTPNPSNPPNPEPTPTPTPPPNPTPTPTPTPTPIGPMCMSIAMDKTNPQVGDEVTFTCGEVPLANHYIFRIITPDGRPMNIDATGRVSAPVLISEPGQYYAQCQICDQDNCGDWEPI